MKKLLALTCLVSAAVFADYTATDDVAKIVFDSETTFGNAAYYVNPALEIAGKRAWIRASDISSRGLCRLVGYHSSAIGDQLNLKDGDLVATLDENGNLAYVESHTAHSGIQTITCHRK
jgi:hypothetical protein